MEAVTVSEIMPACTKGGELRELAARMIWISGRYVGRAQRGLPPASNYLHAFCTLQRAP